MWVGEQGMDELTKILQNEVDGILHPRGDTKKYSCFPKRKKVFWWFRVAQNTKSSPRK
jgi:hypothetical protein